MMDNGLVGWLLLIMVILISLKMVSSLIEKERGKEEKKNTTQKYVKIKVRWFKYIKIKEET